MAKSAAEILQQVNPNALPAEKPPEAANYREADLEGINCMGCAKFVYTGEDGEVPVGYCSLWEATVKGDMVSDGYADPGPPLDDSGDEVWDFSDREKAELHEIYFGDDSTAVRRGKLVRKKILRTGEWDVIPTPTGLIEKPLKIIRDGVSSAKDGVIALSELKQNFDARVIPNVQVPLSDDDEDHKNLTRLNQGFVRELDLVDENGISYLEAGIEFTEPETEEKVLSGTYSDCSSGVPFNLLRKGKKFNAALEHVCITNQPFIDGLGGYMLAASDQLKERVSVVHHVLQEEEKPDPIELSFSDTVDLLHDEIKSFGLDESYIVADVKTDKAIIRHDYTDVMWEATFTLSGTKEEPKAVLTRPAGWEKIEGTKSVSRAQVTLSDRPRSSDDELIAAQRQREARLSLPTSNRAGGA